MTADLIESSIGGGAPADSTTEIERLLSDVLADVMDVERVPVTSDFFDDLGADSLLMAHFCARLSKRADLPTVSIKEVYQHPTISGLASAITSVDHAASPVGASASNEATMQAVTAATAPVGTWQYLLCGLVQLLTILEFSFVFGYIVARGYDWTTAGSGFAGIYLRSALFGGAGFVGWSVLPIVAKWALIGRWKPRQFRIWSLEYVGFWFVKFLVQTNPLVLFAGSPIYVLYLRALGARIGRGVVILSRRVPVCADLLTIGENTVVRKDSSMSCYRADAGWIQTGPVSLGRDALVGESTVLDIDTSLGDGAQLGHTSSLHQGQSIPDGEHRLGSPALQNTEVDYRAVAPMGGSRLRRAAYSTVQLLILVAVTLPLGVAVPIIVGKLPISPAALQGAGSLSFASWAFFAEVLVFSLVLFFGLVVAGLVFVCTVPRVLNRTIKPDVVYPLYGFHYWAHRSIGRLTNVRFFTYLFGDSSYIVHYLYCLGYGVSFEEQTGANFGLNVKHDNPYCVAVGPGTMAADGLSIINADYSSTSFRVSPVTIGSHSFIGNHVAYPSQGKTGENCLHASKVLVPVEGDVREDVGLLGSPSFEIPRLVLRDREFDDMKSGDELGRRLAAKNKHNAVTMWWYLVSRWAASFGVVFVVWTDVILHGRFGASLIGVSLVLVTVVGTIYYVLVERAATGFRPLQPLYCSIYEQESWQIERYWKLSWQPNFLNGTPFKSLVWRLLGVRIGKRVFDDGCIMVDKTLITVGDDCTLNAGSIIQPHSQEDGTFKSDRITIGAGCTVGVGALVHYGVTMGDGATLAADAFLMKGAEVPPHTYWGENPAKQIRADHRPAAKTTTTRAGSATAGPGRTAPRAAPPRTVVGDIAAMNRGQVPVRTRAEAARDYWRNVLLAGGTTTIPRWTLDPGVEEHQATITDDLVAALRQLTRELEVSLSSILLASHAKVLAALAGEQDVATGYAAVQGGRPLPCRLSVEPRSWRALVLESHRVEAELLSLKDFPVDELGRELGLTKASFETVLDPTGGGDLHEDAALLVSVPQHGSQLGLRLRYRTEVLDADAAARIAGYHLTALALIVADPEAEHAKQSLLSADEYHFQLEGLAGANTELPDRRFHELFEERVRAHPDAIAAVHGDRALTYRELNSRANQLGRALLARGLRRESVVAVVTERNLDWMAAVLAILKAGGVYLPIEPHFPADRIATTLSRAECKLVVTEPSSTTTLYEALDPLAGFQGFFVETAYGEGHADDDLDIDVGPDQLAYIYFTSGSTGEPKGAMCEHGGMLNHLYAKIDDLEIGERQTVAQIAPQCFDISLWQLVSALLVGGRTLLVEQETILDPRRFIDKIVDGEVAVLQVVPSYLEVLLSYLEQHPRELPDLHCVSVTGEALTLELTQRWFATEPSIKLANAYGLTETSDDTNHEVMERAPERGRVPLGRAVNNVEVRVVDEHLSPVPLGAPGEIVFSGICVGRGYINDPDRTRQAFMADPLRKGQRLYRSGDFGRWRADGKLEFLGRRDAQVKIRGFRIEIGEIENAMLGVPGVRQAAVVVTERNDRSRQLVGFYSGKLLGVDELQDRLGASLPDYMVPTALHWREGLPLTGNGKVDKKALAVLAATVDVTGTDIQAPNTPAEQRLAAAWAVVLGVPPDQIGRQDNFFDKGGTSLSAVELVIALDSAVSLKDVTQNPVLADLALLVDGTTTRQPGLLQLLSETDDARAGALVCFPYAGGNAVNFHAMAKALRGSGLAVYAVELPGHDLAAESEPFLSMEGVVEQVITEIDRRELTRVMLWGHSSGTAFAVETARQLPDRGVDVQRVFLAAQLLGDAGERRAHIDHLTVRSNTEIAAEIAANSDYTELGDLDAQHAEHVGAAYRHDWVSAHRYLLTALDAPPAAKLTVPVTVVVAADDPSTAEWPHRHRDWQLLAEQVDLHELADGGHYFLRTRPADAAQAVRFVVGTARSAEAQALNRPPAIRSTSPSPSPSPTSPIEVDLQPGKPPLLFVDTDGDAPSWAEIHRVALRAIVTEHGSVTIRGLGLRDRSDVTGLVQRLVADLMAENEAFASREVYPGGVYSSSAWPPNQQMCMHHELSYRLEFPGLMLFACLDAPTSGGAIAVADSPTVLEMLPTEVVERFNREGWMLTRTYSDEIGLSVAEAFGTDNRDAVEDYCRSNAIELEWQPDGGLRTRQRRSAIVRHPITGQRCWFNQVAFLNEWTMNPEVRDFLVDVYGADGMPFNTRYGNGDPIDPGVVQMINEIYEANATREPLQAGDLILVDNIRTAHSREPFEGEREVIVAMADPVRLADVSPNFGVAVG